VSYSPPLAPPLRTSQRGAMGFTPFVPSLSYRQLTIPSLNKCPPSSQLRIHSSLPFGEAISSSQQMSMVPSPNNYDYEKFGTFLTSVKVFDGSELTETVVVSNLFRKMLFASIKTVIVGQLVSVVLFAIFCTVTVNQLPKIGDWVSKSIFQEKDGKEGSRFSLAFVEDFIDKWVQQPSITEINIQKLLLSILIDTIGSTSELVPIIGELTDILWAPIAASALRYMYGSNVVFALEFTEEILPLVDVLPLATFCLVVETFFSDAEIARGLEIGQFRKK